MTTSQASGSEGRASSGFDRLARPVQRWIWDQGWTGLRPIQERAIAALSDGPRDAIIAAGTASGKTEAAFLPLISRVLTREGDAAARGFDLLYVGPLRALINDQFGRLEDLCAKTDLPVHPWHGDISAAIKRKARTRPRGILLITPESLEALFVLRGLEIPGLFSRLEAVVVDELHALLDTERGMHLRSLLARIELAAGRRIPRIGLSATLGDMALARAALRPDAPEGVALIEDDDASRSELQLQLRGYVVADAQAKTDAEAAAALEAATRAVATHIFDKLRGTQNLLFAGSRQNVEFYADRLRRLCEDARLPNEFLPHHASLSRDHRVDLEKRLKAGRTPTTAVCTSTLELGVDIGHIDCVAQVGPPHSVASLRQRLGRSGRRVGRPAVLRLYAIEREARNDLALSDRLRFGLLRSVAAVNLLLSGWCEPPEQGALHLSTLIHQVLSVIAERGGAQANRLFATLCRKGPFRATDQDLFMRLLREMGRPDAALIEQGPDGALLLGREGERVVESHRFYATFQTPEEYRILHKGRALGTLPIDFLLVPGMAIIFAGRRWKVEMIHEREREVEVVPDRSGAPPRFGGDLSGIHDRLASAMREALEDEAPPVFLDPTGKTLLAEAQWVYRQLDLANRRILSGGVSAELLTWRGAAFNETLGLALLDAYDGEVQVEPSDCLLSVQGLSRDQAPLEDVLRRIADEAPPDPLDLALRAANLEREKFHPYLSHALLAEEAATSRIRAAELPAVARELLRLA